ncbi:MAG: GTP-binding protein [Chloroflexi bacterium]|nr:MAG: GTP-binding protein [Chloroflexota bacterium]
MPVLKVVVAGDGGVGKTSLIRRYCTGKFQESRIMTIGVDFQIQVVDLGDRTVKLSIWDIAGQERFGSFRASFYRGARAVALVYDVTDPISLRNLPLWQAEIAKVAPQARFVVVGNKIDLERKVPREKVEAWVREIGLPYLETSALTGEGVQAFFTTLARLAAA